MPRLATGRAGVTPTLAKMCSGYAHPLKVHSVFSYKLEEDGAKCLVWGSLQLESATRSPTIR